MAGPYFCDLAAGTFVDRTGLDATTNKLTGPAGFEAAIRGTGLATPLAAGEIVYLEGTGQLERLVIIDTNGTDVSGWGIGDTVRNFNTAGGSPGDDWTGVVVEPAGTPNDETLVWLASGKSTTDINIADGIENTVAGGGAGDPVSVATLAATVTPGIVLDLNEGTVGGGRIVVQGTTDLTDPTNNFGQAILEGNSQADNCIFTDPLNGWFIGHITVQNAAGSNIEASTSGFSEGWLFNQCKNLSAGGFGYEGPLRSSIFQRCVTRAAASGHNDRDDINNVHSLIESSGSSGPGIRGGNGTIVIDSLVFENTGDNIKIQGNGIVAHTVVDGATDDGIFLNSSSESAFGYVLSSRITNNTGIGIRGFSTNLFAYENFNVFSGNGSVSSAISNGANSDTSPADDGYVDASTDDYNVKSGAEIRSEAIIVNF